MTVQDKPRKTDEVATIEVYTDAARESEVLVRARSL